jgi:hypothetical protein
MDYVDYAREGQYKSAAISLFRQHPVEAPATAFGLYIALWVPFRHKRVCVVSFGIAERSLDLVYFFIYFLF